MADIDRLISRNYTPEDPGDLYNQIQDWVGGPLEPLLVDPRNNTNSPIEYGIHVVATPSRYQTKRGLRSVPKRTIDRWLMEYITSIADQEVLREADVGDILVDMRSPDNWNSSVNVTPVLVINLNSNDMDSRDISRRTHLGFEELRKYNQPIEGVYSARGIILDRPLSEPSMFADPSFRIQYPTIDRILGRDAA